MMNQQYKPAFGMLSFFYIGFDIKVNHAGYFWDIKSPILDEKVSH